MAPEERDMYVQRAMQAARIFVQDQLPQTLLSLSIDVDVERKRIKLRAHFEKAPSEDDIEAIQITSTEVASQYVEWYVEEDWEVLLPGQQPNALPGGIAWRRDDPEPPVVKAGE